MVYVEYWAFHGRRKADLFIMPFSLLFCKLVERLEEIVAQRKRELNEDGVKELSLKTHRKTRQVDNLLKKLWRRKWDF